MITRIDRRRFFTIVALIAVLGLAGSGCSKNGTTAPPAPSPAVKGRMTPVPPPGGAVKGQSVTEPAR